MVIVWWLHIMMCVFTSPLQDSQLQLVEIVNWKEQNAFDKMLF